MVLCDAFTGYCSAFHVYTGKDGGEAGGKGLAHRVVMELMRGYLGCNYHVYADNFFSSFPLVTDLLQHKTYYCGTIRKRMRGFPTAILDDVLMVGDSRRVSNGEVMVCRWCDERDVFMVPTNDSGPKRHH